MTVQDRGDCPGCANPEPRELSDLDLEMIPERSRESIGSTPGRAMICSYCGCVYKINTPPTVFGYLNNPLKGNGWVSQQTACPSNGSRGR